MTGRILIRSLGDEVAVAPETKLAGPAFTVYLAACHSAGARYRHAERAQVAPMRKASAVALALEQAGFAVQLGIGVETDIEVARSDAQLATVTSIAERIAKLHERGIVPMPFQIEGIETQSIGDGFLKRVAIVPARKGGPSGRS